VASVLSKGAIKLTSHLLKQCLMERTMSFLTAAFINQWVKLEMLSFLVNQLSTVAYPGLKKDREGLLCIDLHQATALMLANTLKDGHKDTQMK